MFYQQKLYIPVGPSVIKGFKTLESVMIVRISRLEQKLTLNKIILPYLVQN